MRTSIAYRRFRSLTKEDEVALATRFRTEADLDAARQLVLSHLRFVVHIARGYLGYGLPMGDLVQEGNVGLMKAVKRFDPTVGVRLVSFAVHWIRAEIHEYVLRNWRLVKVATTKSQRKLFFNLRKMKKNLAWLSEEETQAVARDLGVEVSDVREMEQRLSARDMSFDPTPETDEEDDLFAGHVPAGEQRRSGDRSGARGVGRGFQRSARASRSTKLDERSRNILKRRWMTDDKATLHELPTSTASPRSACARSRAMPSASSRADGRGGVVTPRLSDSASREAGRRATTPAPAANRCRCRAKLRRPAARHVA